MGSAPHEHCQGMTDGTMPSVALGMGFGLLDLASSVLTTRWARRHTGHAFFVIALGGLTARMMTTLAGVVLVLAFAPVNSGAFVLAFFTTFAAGLGLEVFWLLRRPA